MRTARLWFRKLWAFCVVSFALAVQAQAATAPAPPAQAMIDALSRANAAVVGVQVSVAEGARSAESLGKQRQGSGVVIGPDGLILTIGYLIMEAENIQIVTQDNKTLPAQAVAYDLATGFGLIKPLLPLRGIAPVPLADTRDVAPGTVLMTATGGEGGDVNMTQLVSQRPFSGYWEYFIESALFGRREAQPRPAAQFAAAVLLQLGQDRLEQTHGHEHVAGKAPLVAHRVQYQQAADADQFAALVEQRRT